MSTPEEDNNKSIILEQFEIPKENLRKDINDIEMMLGSIQKHILVLESQISSIEGLIKKANNPNNQNNDKAKLYALLNKIQDTLSMYYDNYNRFAETRHKYRKEQDDLSYKLTRLTEIELKNLKVPNSTDFLEVMRRFQTNSGDNIALYSELREINDDPLYKI